VKSSVLKLGSSKCKFFSGLVQQISQVYLKKSERSTGDMDFCPFVITPASSLWPLGGLAFIVVGDGLAPSDSPSPWEVSPLMSEQKGGGGSDVPVSSREPALQEIIKICWGSPQCLQAAGIKNDARLCMAPWQLLRSWCGNQIVWPRVHTATGLGSCLSSCVDLGLGWLQSLQRAGNGQLAVSVGGCTEILAAFLREGSRWQHPLQYLQERGARVL